MPNTCSAWCAPSQAVTKSRPETVVSNDQVSYTLIVSNNGPAAADGTVTFNPDGSFSYAPTAADQGLDTGESKIITFDYVANDGSNDDFHLQSPYGSFHGGSLAAILDLATGLPVA